MHIKYVDVILEMFPEARVIEVVRDIRGVCASWQARAHKNRWANRQTEAIIGQWQRSLQLGAQFANDPAIGDRIFRIKYENMRQQPTETLSTLFDFLALPASNSMVTNIVAECDIHNVKRRGTERFVRHGVIDAWKTELSSADIDLCHQLAGFQLRQLGYGIA